MIETIYKTLLICCWSEMLFMGSYLIFGQVAEVLVSSGYERSRKLIGVGFLILGFEYIIFSLFNLRLNDHYFAVALSLSVLSLVGDLFAMAVFPLLDERSRKSPKAIRLEILYLSIYLISIWSVVLFSNNIVIIRVVLFAGLLSFLYKVYYWVTSFSKIYNRAKIKAENYYSESIEGAVEWLPITIRHIIILCFACGVASFAPVWAIIIYMLYAMFVFFYIFAGLMNMTINSNIVRFLSEISHSEEIAATSSCDLEKAELEQSFLRSDLVQHIDDRLERWIADEMYLNSNITIKVLASSLNTNRTYLSNYINAKYKCTFRDWISSLRLSEAKRIMLNDTNVTISDLAFKVGFTSATSFSRAFTRVEGVSPNRWRDTNMTSN